MKPITVILSLFIIVTLSACNTMAGLGKDIQQGGEALERTAQ
ncbi:MAG: entericidin A/B family lipoprotein [Nitrosomonas sp.]|jgi:entericidin B|nr:entericidin A/B family lipoprotein [Nitrosomonas sp.]MCP5250188.1 entericidin A/B family lipoprotein [Burkholderiales bacterium]MDR4520043.1 entericidin A/B family lipoprotein [Nitrosomonas sp.]MDR4652463.1 entericidin A/B family lipoprotein [Nitrosomonas sp.]HQU63451.1 entericidin A/B family lipoprotein [Nitrosomonas sp.]